MASVTIQGVKKNFGEVPILHGVDIEIQDGSFTVLVGPSGCGKSTLLRMIAGLEQINGGEIRIGDKRVNDLPPKERDIAMVFQNYALYPHMSVYNNMAYGLRNRGMKEPEIDARVREAAKFLKSAPCSTASRGNSPAASASASQWAALSCGSQKCSCSTSRCPTSMPNCASRCGSRSANCSDG